MADLSAIEIVNRPSGVVGPNENAANSENGRNAASLASGEYFYEIAAIYEGFHVVLPLGPILSLLYRACPRLAN
jgi:hypothetical protein